MMVLYMLSKKDRPMKPDIHAVRIMSRVNSIETDCGRYRLSYVTLRSETQCFKELAHPTPLQHIFLTGIFPIGTNSFMIFDAISTNTTNANKYRYLFFTWAVRLIILVSL